MISVSSNINSLKYIKPVNFKGSDVSGLIQEGDKALNENRFSDALKSYQEANNQNPEDYSIYRKLGKAYYNLKDYKNADENFKKYLEKNPDDADCLIELGASRQKQGLYQLALQDFEKAYELDNSNDLAKRNILTTKNNLLSVYAPERAYREKTQYAAENLKAALDMTVNYLGADYMSKLKDVTIQFGKTSEMGGTPNIAQYENSKNSITVSDSYIYAAPEVIAAYTVHESIHAHDNDPYTSIREEQDAYEAAAKFWIKNSNDIKDPEMDYAAELYKKSPSSLKDRVEEIYKLRDPSIAETSPNHPPQKGFKFFKSSKKSAASQGIKSYDIIA